MTAHQSMISSDGNSELIHGPGCTARALHRATRWVGACVDPVLRRNSCQRKLVACRAPTAAAEQLAVGPSPERGPTSRKPTDTARRRSRRPRRGRCGRQDCIGSSSRVLCFGIVRSLLLTGQVLLAILGPARTRAARVAGFAPPGWI